MDTSKEAVNLEILLLRDGFGRNKLLADLLQAMLDELEGYREAERSQAEEDAGADF